MTTTLKIAISAGELSGDEHGAALVRAIQQRNRHAEIRGMGGRNLRAAGVDLVVDSEKSASVMGFGPVLRSLSKIFRSLATMKQLIKTWKPDVLVLVDYPDFNLRLARFAKSHGTKVFYFIPPKMWAWRSGRIKLFHQFVDHVGLIFNFEKEFFVSRNYKNATFVGHPFVEQLTRGRWNEAQREAFLTRNNLDGERPILAILPGSRWFEIERHLEAVIGTVRVLRSKHPELQTAIAVAPAIDPLKLQESLPRDLGLTIVRDETLSLLRVARAGLIKSGTSNLQAAFLGLPQMMFYMAPKTSQFIVYNFVKIKEYSLPNVIRPHTIREMTGPEVTLDALVPELESLLFDQDKRSQILRGYDQIVKALSSSDELQIFEGAAGAYERCARLVLSLTD